MEKFVHHALIVTFLVANSFGAAPPPRPPPPMEPELTELKCYGSEEEVELVENGKTKKIKIDGPCVTKHGGKTADAADGPCKVVDCLANARHRLPKDSKDYPRSCFSHSINQFDGKYVRIHSCGPDRGELIPYDLMRLSFDNNTGLDNGYLKRWLQEDCVVSEIPREKVGTIRMCHMKQGKGDCEFIWRNEDEVETERQSGAVVCPGNYLCMPKTDTDADNKVKTSCVCEEGYKTCHYGIVTEMVGGATQEVRKCAQKFLKKTEIGPMDAVCDFAGEMSEANKWACPEPDVNGCKCPEYLAQDFANTYTAHCKYFPRFKAAVKKRDMKDICRKKTRKPDGMWYPVGFEAQDHSMCYCNKGGTPCNGSPSGPLSWSFSIFFSLILITIESTNAFNQ